MIPNEPYDPAKYERPSVTVDVILFTIKDNTLKVLLVKRKAWPYEGYWAVPGGFVKMTESLDSAAERELKEEAGISNVYLEQLYTFGDPDRDPRTRVITIAYFALVDYEKTGQAKPSQSEVSESKWWSIDELPKLAFDHNKILHYALQRLMYKLEYTAVGLELLPNEFTLTELQKVYETILGAELDKRNFRKKIFAMEILDATPYFKTGHHRPARLYTFRKKKPKSSFKAVRFEN